MKVIAEEYGLQICMDAKMMTKGSIANAFSNDYQMKTPAVDAWADIKPLKVNMSDTRTTPAAKVRMPAKMCEIGVQTEIRDEKTPNFEFKPVEQLRKNRSDMKSVAVPEADTWNDDCKMPEYISLEALTRPDNFANISFDPPSSEWYENGLLGDWASKMREQQTNITPDLIVDNQMPPGMSLLAAANGCCSVGSIGHPKTCAAPCKFAYKPSGCKDGINCTRCHLCWWTRKQAKMTKHI